MSSSADPANTTLGPYVLDQPLGRGGMGVVWRASHARTGKEVAVKLLTEERARTPESRRAFAREVRAVAGLDHPGVIRVFDLGTVPDAAPGVLGPGSPWLAMELASASARQVPPTTWPEVAGLLDRVLDALGHAHARGVLHRDLKPDNVLSASVSGLSPWRLADFGLARSVLDTRPSGRVEGTPAYMAPEQVRGRPWEEGPWTDLYAVGCMAWELVTGTPPFLGLPREVLLAQLRHPLPAFRPRLTVPAELEAWLVRVLKKDPRSRFGSAAEARTALHEVGTVPSAAARAGALLERETMAVDASHTRSDSLAITWATSALPMTAEDVHEVTDEVAALGLPDRDAMARPRPPLPGDWRVAEPPRDPLEVFDVGPALFGLRAVPLVGRDDARDALWAALSRVDGGERSELVVLAGSTGVGRTRLSRWIAEQAHAVGGIDSVFLHAGEPGLGPLRTAATHLLGLGGLVGDARLRALSGSLTHLGLTSRSVRDALKALLTDTEVSVDAAAVALAEVIDARRGERPAVVVVDDAHLSSSALRVVEVLLGRRTSRALCVIGDHTGEAGPGRGALDALRARAHAIDVVLEPLPAADHLRLVSDLLGLAPALAVQVSERTLGSPQLAVAVVADWVDRDALVPGPDGMTLRPGVEAAIPDSVARLHAARLERALAELSAEAAVAVERAAVGGVTLRAGTWAAVTGAGAEELEHADAVLHRHGLVHDQGGGWGFDHPVLVDTLVARAEAAGRLATHHQAWATHLEGDQAMDAAPRRGRHLLGAGAPEQALPLLLDASGASNSLGGERALAMLDQAEAALHAVGADPDDGRWISLHVQRAIVHRRRYDLVAAQAALDQALARLRPDTDPDVALDAWVMDAHLRISGRDFGAARARVDALRDRVPEGWRRRVRHLDWLLASATHDHEAAYALALEADTARNRGGDLEHAVDLRRLGLSASATGRWDVAEDAYRRAIPLFRRTGNRTDAAHCHNGIAEALKARGDLEGAERPYLRSLALFESVGDHAAHLPLMNLCLLYLDVGRPHQARRAAERAYWLLERLGARRRHAARVLVGLAQVALGDVSAIDGILDDIEAGGVAEAFLPDTLHRLGKVLIDLDRGRARRALALSQATRVHPGQVIEGLEDTLEQLREKNSTSM